MIQLSLARLQFKRFLPLWTSSMVMGLSSVKKLIHQIRLSSSAQKCPRA
ncbi:hypothetical protein LINPERHAP2_LOCUS41938 [Linum perenne]